MKRAFLLALALGACTQGPDFRGSALHLEHPLTTYVLAEKAAGRHPAITLDSAGGATAAWRGLAAASVGTVSSVTLRGECVSACLLYALTVAAKGVPVHVADGTLLAFHGIGNQFTAGLPSNQASQMQIAFDLAFWQIAGLPQWAIEIERGLTVHDLRPMTQEDIARSRFAR